MSSATVTQPLISTTAWRTHRNPKSISFDTPSLHSFGYSDIVAEVYPLVNMKSLFRARIILVVTEDQVQRMRKLEDDVVLRFRNAVKLMNDIQNVQELDLHSDTIEVSFLILFSLV